MHRRTYEAYLKCVDFIARFINYTPAHTEKNAQGKKSARFHAREMLASRKTSIFLAALGQKIRALGFLVVVSPQDFRGQM